jgi:hypothetical protein
MDARGIEHRADISLGLNYILRQFAKSDFKHDFNEGKTDRDRFAQADEQRFKSILQRYSADKQVKYITEFKNKFVGKNIYEIFGSQQPQPFASFFSSIFPPLAGEEPVAIDEVPLLNTIEIDYEGIKRDISKSFNGTSPATLKEELGIQYHQSDKTFNIKFDDSNTKTRNYTIRAAKYKFGADTCNLSSLFYAITGKKTKFALEIDATGGLSTTSILNNKLSPAPPSQCTFYIINNIENDSDSATKLANFDKGDPSKQATSPQPNVIFLKDKESTVVYPIWGVGGPQAGNLYTSLQIVLNRLKNDEIESNITIGSESYNFGDVANTSNVKNASLNVVASRLLRPTSREQYLFPLLKRMGDWCQALSLLDRSREYKQIQLDRTSLKKRELDDSTTLEQLSADTEIAIVTNDRILLGFSILLGLNVFFTTASDLSSLVYFKNKDDVVDEDALQARIGTLRASLGAPPDEAVLNTRLAEIRRQIETKVDQIKAITIPDQYLIQVKSLFSNLGRLRLNYLSHYNQFQALNPTTEGELIIQFQKLSQQIAINTKLTQDQAYDRDVFSKIEANSYPNAGFDSQFIAGLVKLINDGYRIAKTEPFLNVEKMILSLKDDCEQILQKPELASVFEKLNELLVPTVSQFYSRQQGVRESVLAKRNESTDLVFDLFKSVPKLPVAQEPEPMLGGGLESTDRVYQNIRRLEVQAYTYRKPTTTVYEVYPTPDPEVATFSPVEPLVTAKYKTYYTDEKSNDYSVVDNFIVTKDNLEDFEVFFDKIYQGPPPAADRTNQDYIALKFLFLYNDMLRQQILRLESEEDSVDKPTKTLRVLTEAKWFREALNQATDYIVLAVYCYDNMVYGDERTQDALEYYRGTADSHPMAAKAELNRIRDDLYGIWERKFRKPFTAPQADSSEMTDAAPSTPPSLLGKRKKRESQEGVEDTRYTQKGRLGGKTYRAGKHTSRHSTYRNPI